MDLVKFVEDTFAPKKGIPSFKAGDTITVHYKIREGDKERIQQYSGVVIQIRGKGKVKSFTVRKISNGVGVERIFPLFSPFIEEIEVTKKGDVRRAKLFYLRDLTGKRSRIQEKKTGGEETEEAAATELPQAETAEA